ncbi:MAG: hypothetical protein R3221_02120 [Spongiibacter sp.]|nr:hypothetical protein [Spongiibacter sp.]
MFRFNYSNKFWRKVYSLVVFDCCLILKQTFSRFGFSASRCT